LNHTPLAWKTWKKPMPGEASMALSKAKKIILDYVILAAHAYKLGLVAKKDDDGEDEDW